MKFKDGIIKPDMVIHCPKKEDARALCEHLESLGYKTPMPNHQFYIVDDSKYISWLAALAAVSDGVKITEFSDLIEPDEPETISDWYEEMESDSPMTAVEVLEWLKKYAFDGKTMNETFEYHGGILPVFGHYTSEQILQRITAYEAAKKPKPVEVEWVNMCRIIDTESEGIANNRRCVYEENLKPETPFDEDPDLKEQAEAILKKYISGHEGRYIAVIEEVCRVKEGE